MLCAYMHHYFTCTIYSALLPVGMGNNDKYNVHDTVIMGKNIMIFDKKQYIAGIAMYCFLSHQGT